MKPIAYKFPFTDEIAIISMPYKECDEFRLSQIVNTFIDTIAENTSEQYRAYERILDRVIAIKYLPISNPKEKILRDIGIINIYEEYNKDNRLEFKCLLIHELVQTLLETYQTHIEDYSLYATIPYKLLRPYIEGFLNIDNICCDNLLSIIYFNTTSKTNAYLINAYEKAFLYKMNNQNLPNYKIMEMVLCDLMMNNDALNYLITDIKGNQSDLFVSIIYILIGYIFNPDISTQFFDNEIFKLKSVEKLKKDIDLNNIIKYTTEEIVNIIKYSIVFEKNITELYNDFDIITNSFIKYLTIWFNKLQDKLGKAVQLGINEVTKK